MKHTLTHHRTFTVKLSSLLQYTTALPSLPLLHPAIAHAEKDNGNLHPIVIGSHPDDAQSTSVGAAAMWEWLGQRRCTNVRRSL